MSTNYDVLKKRLDTANAEKIRLEERMKANVILLKDYDITIDETTDITDLIEKQTSLLVKSKNDINVLETECDSLLKELDSDANVHGV